MSLHSVTLRSPFTGSKSSCDNPGKTAADHYPCTAKIYCWLYAFRFKTVPWCPSNPDLSIRLPDTEVWFIRGHCSVQRCHDLPVQLMLAIAHSDLRLMCSCSAMETHFMKHLSTWQSHTLSLHDLLLCGLSAIYPRCFHFTIMTQLTGQI